MTITQKLDEAPFETRERVTLVNADMRNFKLNERFALVTIPFGPFNYLVSADDQISCLECIRKHLATNGKLIIDFWYPNLRNLWESENGAEILYEKKPFGSTYPSEMVFVATRIKI